MNGSGSTLGGRRRSAGTIILGVLIGALLAGGPAAWADPLVPDAMGLNFNGTNLSQLPALNGGYEFIPPDTMGAIGPNNFVEISNGSFAIYDKTTGALVGSRVGPVAFWTNAGITGLTNPGGSGATVCDQHVLFDTATNKWFAVGIDIPPGTATNRFLVARSDTSDPTGTWKAVAVTASASANVFGDFPMVGINNDALVITCNNFSQTTGAGLSTSALVLPKADLILATPSVANKTLVDGANYNNTGFSPHPAVDMNNGTGSLAVLSDYNTPAGVIKRTDILNTNVLAPNAASWSTSRSLISMTALNQPPNGQQPGGPNTVDTGDNRFSGQVWQMNGHIWGVQDVANPVGGHSALRWVRLSASTNAVEETGIIGDSTEDYYYGGIAVNSAGDIVLGYTRSGASEVPSAYYSAGYFNGTSTTFDSPVLTQAGTGNYNVTFGGPSNRWGDYSQTTLDPSNPYSFWTIQEYVDGTNNWGNNITQVTFPAPEPATLVLLGLGGIAIVARRKRAR